MSLPHVSIIGAGQVGATQTLVKPFTPEELLLALEKVLDSAVAGFQPDEQVAQGGWLQQKTWASASKGPVLTH